MLTKLIAEARRQVEVCNACRYCEGYCEVFPAIQRQRTFADSDILQLANLCHNCRGCYYACQYATPHEFNINIPAILSDVRQKSWEEFSWPERLASTFHKKGAAIAITTIIALILLFLLVGAKPESSGKGFYATMSHTAMVLLFLPAFLAPLFITVMGIRRYWQSVNGTAIRWHHVQMAFMQAATMRNLSGGKNQGCNFESGDRYSHTRRYFHQATMWGFFLCFASTATATLMHYLLGLTAPYGLFSVPKLLGVPGGLLLVIGCAGLGFLKTRADPLLGSQQVWGSEMAFVILLGLTGLSGLVLYAVTGTAAVATLLVIHLACVLTLFLLLPYSKMVHGFFRIAALIRASQLQD